MARRSRLIPKMDFFEKPKRMKASPVVQVSGPRITDLNRTRDPFRAKLIRASTRSGTSRSMGR